jgi:hypothetical protein
MPKGSLVEQGLIVPHLGDLTGEARRGLTRATSSGSSLRRARCLVLKLRKAVGVSESQCRKRPASKRTSVQSMCSGTVSFSIKAVSLALVLGVRAACLTQGHPGICQERSFHLHSKFSGSSASAPTELG